MAIDFGRFLSEAARECLARKAIRIDRLYHSPDEWLARLLLHLARQVRADYPAEFGASLGCGYNWSFVWDVVPAVARRLAHRAGGVLVLEPNEAVHRDVVELQGQDFRVCVGAFLQHQSLDRLPRVVPEDRPSAASILGRLVVNGNPVAIALCRLEPAPPRGHDRDDFVARSLREISRVRGFDETPEWRPELQGRFAPR